MPEPRIIEGLVLSAGEEVTVIDGGLLRRLPIDGTIHWTAAAHGCQVVWLSPDELTARAVDDETRTGVELVGGDGAVVAYQYQLKGAVSAAEDVEADRFAQERTEAIDTAHKAMLSSYIGKPPPILRGDAERMVDALIARGWGPLPADTEPADWDDWPESDER